ncbi:MAG TPA: Sec-independent protein translocase subunit TatB [Campylobacterales bacterium]|nr:Sec-independent protein translocase subunit TatB [Campylobacterales bacterium]HIO70880.1 Sec-independent protein translocase subunit TatB [Campylobacterales bacterium]
MFDLGFSEILLIAVIAIVILGPEKLPEALAQTFKFFKRVKNVVFDIKDSIDKELQIEELREEANRYKEELMSASKKLEELANMEIAEPINSEVRTIEKTKQEVTLKKESAKAQLKALLEDKKDV